MDRYEYADTVMGGQDRRFVLRVRGGWSASRPFRVTMKIINPRMTARITTYFFLRQGATVSDVFGGGLILGLVFFGIGAANNRLILQGRDLVQADGALSDTTSAEDRRPISVSALARSLGLPFETTRRYVAKLVAQDMCVQTSEGLLITEVARTSERVSEAVKRNNADVKWFIFMLRRGNVDIDAI